MLYEISHLRQTNRSLTKRWFSSRDMDLFVWFRKNMPVRFQLTYNKRSREEAISWGFRNGFRFYRVDNGENDLQHYKKTPILINCCTQQDLAKLARNFLAACENIDISLSDFIYARLLELPILQVTHNAMHINQHQAVTLRSVPKTV